MNDRQDSYYSILALMITICGGIAVLAACGTMVMQPPLHNQTQTLTHRTKPIESRPPPTQCRCPIDYAMHARFCRMQQYSLGALLAQPVEELGPVADCFRGWLEA